MGVFLFFFFFPFLSSFSTTPAVDEDSLKMVDGMGLLRGLGLLVQIHACGRVQKRFKRTYCLYCPVSNSLEMCYELSSVAARLGDRDLATEVRFD